VASSAYDRWLKDSRKLLVRMTAQALHGRAAGSHVLWLNTEYDAGALERGEQDVKVTTMCVQSVEGLKELRPQMYELLWASGVLEVRREGWKTGVVVVACEREDDVGYVAAAKAGARVVPLELPEESQHALYDMMKPNEYANLLNRGAGDCFALEV
jgi:hypothetical protein